MSNIREREVLVALYEYFLRNGELLRELGREVGSYQRADNPRMEMSAKSSMWNSQGFGVKQRNVHTSSHNNRALLRDSRSQLNLRSHPFDSRNSTMLNKTGK